MMTTMAALLGGLPLALGSGTGAELRRPLGITIVGGLLLSQLLTLYTTPVVYLWFDRLAHRFERYRIGNPIPHEFPADRRCIGCRRIRKRANRANCVKTRDTSRGSPRSFGAQRAPAQDDSPLNDEYLGSIYPASDWHVAAGGGAAALRDSCLQLLAGGFAAQSGLSRDQRWRRLARRGSETMASAVATPLERQFGRIAAVNQMTSTSQLGSTSVVLAV